MPAHVGVWLKDAFVIHPQRYMAGLWAVCEAQAAEHAAGSCVRLICQHITSLQKLQTEGQYDAVVLASGAAAATLPEVPHAVSDLLELSQVCILANR